AAQNLDVDRLLFAEQVESDADPFLFCVDRKLSHFPNRAQLRVECDPRRESQRRVFGTMKNISQAVRSKISRSVYDSRELLLIWRQQLAISPHIAESRVDGQGNRNPNQHRTGFAPRPQPPGGCLSSVMEFRNGQEREEENYGNNLPRRLLFAEAF